MTYCGNNVSGLQLWDQLDLGSEQITLARAGPSLCTAAAWLERRRMTCAHLSLALWVFSLPQIVFEVVTSGQRGLLAIKDVVVQGHQCSKSFFYPFAIKEYHHTQALSSPWHPPNTCIISSRPSESNKRPSKTTPPLDQCVNVSPSHSCKIYELSSALLNDD